MKEYEILTKYLFPVMLQIIVMALIAVVLRNKNIIIGYESVTGVTLIVLSGVSSALWGILYQCRYNHKSFLDIIKDFFNVRQSIISYMTFCGNIINKMELGFSYDDANVCDKIADIEIPVLIINSEADTITPHFMGQEIYDSIHNDEMKMIWTVSDSEHTEMWLDYNQEYREKVQEVLGYIK